MIKNVHLPGNIEIKKNNQTGQFIFWNLLL